MTQGLISQVNLLNSLVLALEKEKKTLKEQNQRLHGQFASLAQDHDRFAHDLIISRQKNQELYNNINNLTEKLKRLDGVENAFLSKQKELTFFKTQNQKFETIITKNKETINQLTVKIYDVQKQQQQKSQYFSQTIRDLENIRISEMKTQKELNDRKILELNSEISRQNAQINELKTKKTKQSKANQEQRLRSNKINQELAEKYADAVKTSQGYSKSILSLESYQNEIKSLLEKEKALTTSLQNKIQVDTIVINKLQNELKQERKNSSQNINKLNKLLTQERYLLEKKSKQYSELFERYQSLQIQKLGGQSQLYNNLSQQNRFNKELQAQITQLNLQIQRLLTQNQEKENQIEENNVEIDILEKKITEKQALINQGQFQQSDFRRQIQKLRKAKVDLQVELKSLQQKYLQLRNQSLQQKSQYKKKQDLLKQKLLSLQKQVRKLEDQIHSSKLSNLVQGQSKNQKDVELAASRKIINQQEKYIADQKIATERLGQLLSLKQKEIENLQANNSMLRKQVLNALANEDSTRKEMLLQKQKQISSKRMSKVDSRRQLSRKSSGDHLFKKRFTVLFQPQDTHDSENTIFRRSQQDLGSIPHQNFKQSLVQKVSIPSSDNDYKDI